MPDRITLQVSRYRPEQESDATFDEFEVPCSRDWVVLDGLNYVKDCLDGTLSYRWSCRMGVCGSCGMTVNGEPKAHLRDVSLRLRARPRACGTAAQLPGHPRSRGGHWRLHAQAGAREALDRSRRGEITRRRRVSPDARRTGRVQAVQHVHQLHAVTPRVQSMVWIRSSSVRRRLRWRRRYNLDGRDEGAAQRMEILSEHEGIWGCTFVGECTRVCPKNVDPAGAIQRYKLSAALESVRTFFMPRGA